MLSAAALSACRSPSMQAPQDEFAEYARGLREKISASHSPELANSPGIIAAEQRSGDIVIFRAGSDWNKPENQLWRCNAAKCGGVKKECARWFGYVSDCKPVLGCTHVLASFSNGGVALIRVSDKRVVFYAHAGRNPHSACMLPDGNIVAVSSSDNRLTVYAASKRKDGEPCREFVSYPLDFAHGAVWDARQKLLWAIARGELAAYEYNFDKYNPRLIKKFSCALPPEGVVGHDLYPAPGTRYLFYTGNGGVGVFDTVSRRFAKISGERAIKSVSMSKPDGAVIFLKPEEKWWADHISNANAALTVAGFLRGARFYKARWFVADAFSEGEKPRE